jgi:hypothetical protein
MSQLKNPFFDIDTDSEEFITPLTNAIYQGVMDDQNSTRSEAINRPSSSGSCVRQLWYKKNGYEAQKLAGRAYINFMAGALGEFTMIHFLKKYCVGEGKPFKQMICGEPTTTFYASGEMIQQYKQIETKTTLPSGRVLPGSIDFMVQYHDGTWAIGDCKTASEFGFKRVKQTNDPESYKYQAHCYMMSDLGLKHDVKKFIFVYMRKTTGHLYDFTIDFDQAVVKEIDDKFTLANGPNIPDRPYEPEEETYYKKPTGRWVLPWQCSYCGFAKHCWPTAKKDFKKDQFGNYKPALVIEDKKEEIA